MKPNEQLQELGKLYETKSKLYGSTYKDFGYVMAALFPDGINLTSNADFNRFGILVQMVNKICRYVHQFNNPLSDDHLNDLAVYAAMLNELDVN